MSTQEVGKYRQFFDVDEKYFPCIDDSAIEAGAPWENTYPHETFIELLKNVETMLFGDWFCVFFLCQKLSSYHSYTYQSGLNIYLPVSG